VLSHDRIWSAIDALAARHGLTASGLARRAGLDPTAFNKSKRVGGGGRLRWPSTESLSKVLDATGTSADDLMILINQAGQASEPLPPEPPVPGLEPALPALTDIAAALRRPGAFSYVVRQPGLPPLFRADDRLVVDPDQPALPGTRMLLFDRDGNVVAGDVVSYDDDIVLAIPGGDGDIRRDRRDVVFAARIVWASQ
jgi:phage repressor protein C with HTH and peptisase S24 domain